MNKKVAIIQDNLNGGGRTKVILHIIGILNRLGITPDIFTYHASSKDRIMRLYGKENMDFRIIPLPSLAHNRLSAYKIPLLNVFVSLRSFGYDLIFNYCNETLFLPGWKKCISYINFPEKAEIDIDLISRSFPERGTVDNLPLPRLIYRKLRQSLYSFHAIHKKNRIIAISQYAREAILKSYKTLGGADDVMVIYPPVELDKFWFDEEVKYEEVVTLGRICPHKRQMEQLKIAEMFPELTFNIIGVIESVNYFGEMCAYMQDRKIDNVHMYTDCSIERVRDLLKRAKFYLHNFRNEPFGISTVEAIAAGCIPITHNSGGQKEVVPDQDLRFEALEGAKEILKKLTREELRPKRQELQDHIRHYDESIFQDKMGAILGSCL
jgi:glycosyltransferase involved in cell wall biosynthesis